MTHEDLMKSDAYKRCIWIAQNMPMALRGKTGLATSAVELIKAIDSEDIDAGGESRAFLHSLIALVLIELGVIEHRVTHTAPEVLQ